MTVKAIVLRIHPLLRSRPRSISVRVITMIEHAPERDPEETDERATQPTSDDPPETDDGGPQGNPEVDEEALRHQQQDEA
jgi:hypothetical protein